MSQRLMVLVKYDLFPYCLVFEVEKFLNNGGVKAKDVGCFRQSAILRVMTLTAGRKLKKELENLRVKHRKELAKIATLHLMEAQALTGCKLK